MTRHTFNPSDEELELATHILTLQGFTDTGALRGAQARDVFDRSGLDPIILRDVWTIADENKSGDLTRDELSIAIRLIGWVQAGESLHPRLLMKAGPLPTLDGITSMEPKKPTRRPPPTLIPPIPMFPIVREEQVQKAKRKFNEAGPTNGSLTAEKVRDVYMNTCNLSFEDIRRVMTAVDKNSNFAFDFAEFGCGFYLIQALESSQLHSVPSNIPSYLFDQFRESITIPEASSSSPPLASPPHHQSSSSLNLPSLQTTPPTPAAIDTTLPVFEQRQESWDIPPHERAISEVHFKKLDEDNDGFIDKEDFGRFISIYKISSPDLDRVWSLTDMNSDGWISRDEFIVAFHLVKQRSSLGEEIPTSLPPNLVPPSARPQNPTPPVISPSSSPTISTKKPPPPVPPKKRDSIARRTSASTSASTSPSIPTKPSKYSVPMSPPISPSPPNLNHQTKPSISTKGSNSSIFEPSSSKQPPVEVLSPFEDPGGQPFASRIPPQAAQVRSSPSHTSSPSASTFDTSHQEALDGFKQEISRLSRQVEILLGQLAGQNNLRDINDNLRSENDRLKTEVKDIERMMFEVLSANESSSSSQEEHAQEITRLVKELADKETLHERSERMLAVVTQNERELRESLRESQSAASKATAEVADLKQIVITRDEEITDLKTRLSDMGKAMAEPDSTTSNRELRVLIRDVTRENDTLKSRVRDMERSMEQMLLSTKHVAFDEMGRENKRLTEHVRDLEGMVTQLQSSVGVDRADGTERGKGSGSGSSQGALRENELLKSQLRDGKRVFAEFRSSSETKLVELQQKVEALVQENNRLKIDAHHGNRREDRSVPPPAYDDDFVIPPE